MPESVSTTACTVATRAHLPAAVVLARTYLEHHPGHEFVVFVADGEAETGSRSAHRVVGSDWLKIDIDEYRRLATYRTEAEFLDAVTPLVLRQLLDQGGVAVHLHPQTRVYAPFADLTARAAGHDVVLAPRLLAPVPRDGLDPGPDAGAFAKEFVAVGQGARPFLDFWAERARDPAPATQRSWFDQVPALFGHHVLRDPGAAVAYWNLHERALDATPDGAPTAAGLPLRFFHFSGYRPRTPWLLSADCVDHPRVRVSEHPRLRALCEDYRTELLAAGHEADKAGTPYGFGALPDGTPITDGMRELYRSQLLRGEEAALGRVPFSVVHEVPPHPFGEDGGQAFRRWLGAPGSPRERAAGLNRLAVLAWEHRPDVQAAFPQPYGRDATGFRQWCRRHGVAEGALPAWAVPEKPPPVEPPADELGVNVAGYHTAELGIGEMGRVLLRTVEHASIPMIPVVEEHSLGLTVRTGLDAPKAVTRPRFPVSIITVNADYTQVLLDSHPEVGHRRYRIGLWAWELEEFPRHLHQGFALVDEVWTVSEFTRRAIEPHAPVPVRVFPVPVLDPGEVDRAPRRPGEPVRFLFLFDFNSTGARKNPWGLVSAFQRAFPGRDDVRLVIKATNGHRHTAAVERLRYLVRDDPRIELLERYLSVAELNDLYAGSDAYVSLHRSEGFGLTLAEAMVRGMPVISTDYAGTTEFVSPQVGWTVPYTLVEVGPGWPPYQPDAHWADPDLEVAARAMREVADDPEEARLRGRAAREHILRTRSLDAAAEWVRARVEDAYRTWRGDASRRRGATPAARLARRVIDRYDLAWRLSRLAARLDPGRPR